MFETLKFRIDHYLHRRNCKKGKHEFKGTFGINFNEGPPRKVSRLCYWCGKEFN